MPAKKTTIATAEKRVIKSEISTLKKALRKVQTDCNKELSRAKREDAADRAAALKRHNKFLKFHARVKKAGHRGSASIERRVAILEGRLNS